MGREKSREQKESENVEFESKEWKDYIYIYI